MKKLSFILILFTLCFLATLALKKYGVIREPAGTERSFRSEKYELQESDLKGLDKMDVLQRLDAERTILINNIIPSVVCISAEGEQQVRFENSGMTRYAAIKDIGSGVVVSHEGHIITNHHVVSGKERFVISLHDGREYKAKVIGSDPSLDIAILKINVKKGEVNPLKFGNSDEVKVGQTVFAVGNPFGLGETVTQGIISAKERSFSDQQRDLFQTDAAINPGNSGGPLVNTRGEVIGINVATFTSKEGEPRSQGVGFSLPSNEVLATFKQIAERGKPVRGYLGVKGRDLTPEIQTFLRYNGAGVAIEEVFEGTPAEKAGLLPKDIIVSYGGTQVTSASGLIRLIKRSEVGKETLLEVVRDGEMIKLKVQTMDSLNWEGTQQSIKDNGFNLVNARVNNVGVRVRNLEWVEKRRGYKGVVIYAVNANSLASTIGLRRGDRILKVNGKELATIEEFYQFLIDIKPGEVVNILVQRLNFTPKQISFSMTN